MSELPKFIESNQTEELLLHTLLKTATLIAGHVRGKDKRDWKHLEGLGEDE